MEWNFGERRLQAENGCLKLFVGLKLIYEIDCSEMPWHSEGMPWHLRRMPWHYRACEWRSVGYYEREGSCRAEFQDGQLQCRLTLERDGEAVRMTVEFHNSGDALRQFACGVACPVAGKEKSKVTIPHLIYNDNPSADPDRIVPHIGEAEGEGTIAEEHRLPIPGINIEWSQGGSFPYLTLLSVPQVLQGEEEEYWALGALREKKGYRMVTTSGPLMFNGMKDVFYGGRCTPLPYRKGYRTLNKGESLVKVYYLSWGASKKEGRGFCDLVRLGYCVLRPRTLAQHTQQEMIAYKKQVLDSRFFKNDECCGYLTFGAANEFGNISGRPEFFLYGWTGQALKLAWCDCALGLFAGEAFRLKRGMEAADFFVKNGESRIPGLYCGYYQLEEKQWAGDWQNADAALSSRIEGESLCDLIDIMLLLQKEGIKVPGEWELAVGRACAFLTDEQRQTEDGLYPLAWNRDGRPADHFINAAGMPCVQALVKAWKYFGRRELLDYAEAKYALYAKHHMKTFERPFARATMDAGCEDKESGIYFFTAAAELFAVTGEERFREWAGLAADWILTFVFLWETGFQKGTPCEEKHFCTTGWPGVSVQNHHLDVFFPVYELYEFGRLTACERLCEMALHVRDALTYGVCTEKGEWGYTVVGEQGEQYYQTNYFQLRYPEILKYMSGYRGGMQVWNPSWITAQVLSSAIRFCYFRDEGGKESGRTERGRNRSMTVNRAVGRFRNEPVIILDKSSRVR